MVVLVAGVAVFLPHDGGAPVFWVCGLMLVLAAGLALMLRLPVGARSVAR